MLVLIFSLFLVFLILVSAIFIANGGMELCEDSMMVKALVGGFLGLYVVAAVGLKLVLPAVPSNQVDAASLLPSQLSSFDTGLTWPWSTDNGFGV